jgi:WG containing repeat
MRTLRLIGLALVLLALAACGSWSQPAKHYLIRQQDLWGYIDQTGKTIIAPQFHSARRFAEGRAAVEQTEGKVGYIDETGAIIIEPSFEVAENFSEGLAAVKRDGKWGYVDPTGKIVIEPRFAMANSFSGGLAAVQGDDKKWGYIDPTGKQTIPAQFQFAQDFAEGLAMVRIEDSAGYIDTTGKLVIPAQFGLAHGFSEGVAALSLGGRDGYIDRTGTLTITSPLGHAHEFSIRIDTVSNEIIFFPDEDFHEGLAAIGDGKAWGYIDMSGTIAIPPQFDEAYPFSNGLAAVRVGGADQSTVVGMTMRTGKAGGKVGYIDKAGKLVIPAQFDEGFPFVDGLAKVSIGDKMAYIDTSGNVIWQVSE